MKKSITAKLGGMLLSTFLPLNLLAIRLRSRCRRHTRGSWIRP